MSFYPPEQHCPRCRFPLTLGAVSCTNCGLILPSRSGPPRPSQSGPARPSSDVAWYDAPRPADSPGSRGQSGPAMYRPEGQSAPRAADPWSQASDQFNRQSGPQYQQPGASGGFSGAGDASTRYERPQANQPAPSNDWNRPVGGQRPFSGYQGSGPQGTSPGWERSAEAQRPPAGYGTSPTNYQRPPAPSVDRGWGYAPPQTPADMYQGEAGPYTQSQSYRGGSSPMYQPDGQTMYQPGGQPMYQPGGQSWQQSSAAPSTAYPGSQPAYDPFAFADSAFGPPMLPPPRSKKPLLIVLAVLVVLGLVGGGAGFLFLRSRPTIAVSSKYTVGSTPAGAASTTLHFTGTQFAPHSAVSFLLDGQPEPEHQIFQSDANGGLAGDLAVTAHWPTGQLTLTAKDASGNTTLQGKTIAIVTPGEANTPGPKGAPADDTPSFTIHLTGKSHDPNSGETHNFSDILVVTGHPDPAGGMVCNPDEDTGKPVSEKGTTTDGTRVTATYTSQCSGTYKGGQVTYKQIYSDVTFVYSNGLKCEATAPFVNQELDGSFTSATNVSGKLSSDAPTFTCNNGRSTTLQAIDGTWSGSISA